jgi:iron(III) transport system ATP-binding protein
VVFQDAALFPHLRVADNVAFGLPRGKGREARVAELLALVQLSGLGARYPHELSGGQQQRVALARALAPEPRVVLFDEAFGNLDPSLRSSVRDQTVDALRATGAAGVFVTHDQAEALAVGDRIAVMNGGRVEQACSPAEAFHRPANRFVATFLGEADFLPGASRSGAVTTELGVLPTVTALSGDVGADVEVMLRPHEVTFRADEAGTSRVATREFRGATYLYALELPSGARVHSLQPHTLDVAAGTRVTVTVDAGHPLQAFPPHHH